MPFKPTDLAGLTPEQVAAHLARDRNYLVTVVRALQSIGCDDPRTARARLRALGATQGQIDEAVGAVDWLVRDPGKRARRARGEEAAARKAVRAVRDWALAVWTGAGIADEADSERREFRFNEQLRLISREFDGMLPSARLVVLMRFHLREASPGLSDRTAFEVIARATTPSPRPRGFPLPRVTAAGARKDFQRYIARNS